jgi:hypothetical protein
MIRKSVDAKRIFFHRYEEIKKMKKLLMIVALSGIARVIAAPSAPASDPFADCDKYVRKLAKSNLKPKKQTALSAILVQLKNRKDALERKLALGLLSDSEQLELSRILTFDINL